MGCQVCSLCLRKLTSEHSGNDDDVGSGDDDGGDLKTVARIPIEAADRPSIWRREERKFNEPVN